MKILVIKNDGSHQISEKRTDINEFLAAEPALVWVDLAGDTDGDADAEAVLKEIFQFHPLAVDDALNEIHIPKIDDWGDYLYLVLRDVIYRGDELDLPELDIFLGERYIVTYHLDPCPAVARVWQKAPHDSRLVGRGSDFLLYQIIDELVENCTRGVDVMLSEMEELEATTISDTSAETLEEIMRQRRQVLYLRRMVSPQRDVVAKLSRDPLAVIDESERIFFRDVYDHLLRLYDLIDNMRDLTAGALEIHLSVVNNRMNDIMKTLTVITTMFMPLTFLTGFFGMNFFSPTVSLSGWTGWVGFYLMLGIVLLAPAAMYWWMRRRGWMT